MKSKNGIKVLPHKNDFKFTPQKQYHLSNQLDIDSILLENMNFDEYNLELFNLRKKIKTDLDKKTLLLIIQYYILSLTSTTHNILYKWEKNLIKEFINFKTKTNKQRKENNPKFKFNMDPLNTFIGEFILHIQSSHNVCNILFDILNTKNDYKRNQMVNFNKELEKIKESKLIDEGIYTIYKQFNDIRNMFLHEDYMSLIIMLNVEELEKIVKLLKLVELANIFLMRTHYNKIGEIIKYYIPKDDSNIGKRIEFAEEFYRKQCLEIMEENYLEVLKNRKGK